MRITRRKPKPDYVFGLDPLVSRLLLHGDGVTVVYQGRPDLQVEITDKIKLPTQLLSGGGKKIFVPLEITNIDSAGPSQVALATEGEQTVDIKLSGRPKVGIRTVVMTSS